MSRLWVAKQAQWTAGGRHSKCALVQIKELLPECVLGVTVHAHPDSAASYLVGSAVMPLFSKKGRLKTSLQRLRLHRGCRPDLRWPSATPGKVPVAERGERGILDHKLKQFERGELPRCPWLDSKAFAAFEDLETSLAAVCTAPARPHCVLPCACPLPERAPVVKLTRSGAQADTSGDLYVLFYLPPFADAVLFSQPQTPLPRLVEALDASTTTGSFAMVYDAEVAQTSGLHEMNPCEAKALKLSQAAASTGMERCVTRCPWLCSDLCSFHHACASLHAQGQCGCAETCNQTRRSCAHCGRSSACPRRGRSPSCKRRKFQSSATILLVTLKQSSRLSNQSTGATHRCA